MLDRESTETRFTLNELSALIAMRDADQPGDEPCFDQLSFEARYGIDLTVRPTGELTPPVYWWCHLGRQYNDHLRRELTIMFCAVPERHLPPTAGEILQWLAMGVAHRIAIPNRRGWAARYHITRSGLAVSPCYRGVVRAAHTFEAFESALAAEHRALLTFLGVRGFAELMSSVGIEIPESELSAHEDLS